MVALPKIPNKVQSRAIVLEALREEVEHEVSQEGYKAIMARLVERLSLLVKDSENAGDYQEIKNNFAGAMDALESVYSALKKRNPMRHTDALDSLSSAISDLEDNVEPHLEEITLDYEAMSGNAAISFSTALDRAIVDSPLKEGEASELDKVSKALFL
jgi:hypothetical protein